MDRADGLSEGVWDIMSFKSSFACPNGSVPQGCPGSLVSLGFEGPATATSAAARGLLIPTPEVDDSPPLGTSAHGIPGERIEEAGDSRSGVGNSEKRGGFIFGSGSSASSPSDISNIMSVTDAFPFDDGISSGLPTAGLTPREDFLRVLC